MLTFLIALMDNATIDAAIEELSNARSGRRRSAAKTLRAARSPRAAAPLISALSKEIDDRRTWETQYQMIMALAACGSHDARAPIERVLQLPLEPMVHLAAGDALVRLSEDLDSAVLGALDSESLPRIEGAVRALAITQRVPSDAAIQGLLRLGSDPKYNQVRFWLAAASAGWPDRLTRSFLEECLHGGTAETRRAARASLEGRYIKWNPL